THQRGDTGTNSAAWTVGYTPSISTAVWVGDPANSAIKNSNGSDIFGRGLPGAIWQRFMNVYLMGTPMETFPAVKLIGPPPPVVNPQPPSAPRTREPRNTTPFATPEPNPEDFVPAPTEPSTRPNKSRRDACFPFCDNAPPDDQGLGRRQRHF
ncbi:MAG: transglycosylase domain-containing protein, partial [Pseudonocardiaceae bacterium]